VPKKVLILDNDLGFLLWLADALVQAGFEPIPAHNVAEAEQMLPALSTPIDLLIFNAALPRARGFTETLRCKHKQLLLLALVTETGALNTAVPGVGTLLRKPHVVDDWARWEWVNVIRKILRSSEN
jgi:DNA-binding response OmpR family regulator